ncbi:MAG: FAD-dependent oxidoreductase [Ferroplasma sp.]
MPDKIVIIGGGIAGVAAKRLNKKAILIDKSPFMTIAPRLIDVVSGAPKEYALVKRATDITGEVTDINFQEKEIYIGNETIGYDIIIIATGHSQKFDFIKGYRYLTGFTTIDDAVKLRENFGTDKKIVIIGGGYMGVELAGAISGKNTTVIEAGKTLLPGLPPELGHYASLCLKKSNIAVELDNPVLEVTKDNVITENKEYAYDIAVFAGGLTGSIPLINKGNKKMMKITVNKYLQSIEYKDAYAAGDSMQLASGFAPMSAIMAEASGLTAMKNVMGNKVPFSMNNFANIIRIGNNYFGEVENRFVSGAIARIIKHAGIALAVNRGREL